MSSDKGSIRQKEPSEVIDEKSKKKLLEKLNVKLKNNFSQYVTIEPLLCIFLIRYLMFILQQPYNLVKVRGILNI